MYHTWFGVPLSYLQPYARGMVKDHTFPLFWHPSVWYGFNWVQSNCQIYPKSGCVVTSVRLVWYILLESQNPTPRHKKFGWRYLGKRKELPVIRWWLNDQIFSAITDFWEQKFKFRNQTLKNAYVFSLWWYCIGYVKSCQRSPGGKMPRFSEISEKCVFFWFGENQRLYPPQIIWVCPDIWFFFQFYITDFCQTSESLGKSVILK